MFSKCAYTRISEQQHTLKIFFPNFQDQMNYVNNFIYLLADLSYSYSKKLAKFLLLFNLSFFLINTRLKFIIVETKLKLKKNSIAKGRCCATTRHCVQGINGIFYEKANNFCLRAEKQGGRKYFG